MHPAFFPFFAGDDFLRVQRELHAWKGSSPDPFRQVARTIENDFCAAMNGPGDPFYDDAGHWVTAATGFDLGQNA
jgi:hypothetical protein